MFTHSFFPCVRYCTIGGEGNALEAVVGKQLLTQQA